MSNRLFGKPSAVIVDIDGTIADKGDRNPYDFSKVGEDTVIEPIRELVEILSFQYVIVFVSGRGDDCRYETQRWLRDHGIPWDELLMRPASDKRPDEIVKRELYENDIEPFFDVKYVLDDRNKVVKMWRELGLTVLQVADGDF